MFAWESQSDNLVTSGEAARAFAGYRDVVKLDGGGSFICRQNGKEQSTAEDRVICSILRLPEKQEGLELTEDQERFDRMMEDWMARRAKEPASQWAQEGLEQAKAKGITDGTRPRSMATWEEVALMVNKVVEIR